MKSIADWLGKLLEEARELKDISGTEIWAAKVASFLEAAGYASESASFRSLNAPEELQLLAMRIGHVRGLIAREETARAAPVVAAEGQLIPPPVLDSKKVFVVHGHDNEAKEQTARFLERLGLKPIILHEQASSSRTIIEKFEIYSADIAFAVVLLTPDDVGAMATMPASQRPRARQNVIMELGYFIGKLGRGRVCALYKVGIELPSDYQGVLYIEMDPTGAWKLKLAQELVEAKLPIELNGLLGA